MQNIGIIQLGDPLRLMCSAELQQTDNPELLNLERWRENSYHLTDVLNISTWQHGYLYITSV